MEFNIDLLEEIKKSFSKLLVVTKYYDKEKTWEIIDFFEKYYNEILFWFWENRVWNLKEKNLAREKTHFIWNIQTKEIKNIVKYSSFIHSVCSIKHIQKIQEICEKNNFDVKIFIQINIDENKNTWINENEIEEFLNILKNCKNIELLWFSWMWKFDFTNEEKEKEFDFLLNLRDKHLPNSIISAWTSLDYKIAIKKQIDVLRIGSWIFKK